MNKKLLISVVCGLLSTTAMAAPFGEAVCHDEVSYKNIYSGPVQCDDQYEVQSCTPTPNGFDITKENITKTLYSTVSPTTDSSIRLTEMVEYWYSQGAGPSACTIPEKRSTQLSCVADILFSHQEMVVTEVCDYKPEAKMGFIHGTRSVNVSSWSRDYDGYLVSEELWVDGVKQSGSSITLTGNRGESFNVKVVAVDNDGYSSSKTQTVVIPDRTGRK